MQNGSNRKQPNKMHRGFINGGFYMNIDTFKMFCLVVDMGSVSQAANLSFVSQPAVSKQIQHLESAYGVLLFERKDGRLSVTKNGELLYPYAKSIVDEYNRSQEAIQETRLRQYKTYDRS